MNRMLELELEQCRTSYQREYERTRERLMQVETENIELCKAIDENTVDDAMKQQISNVIQENLVRLIFYYIEDFLGDDSFFFPGPSSTNSNESCRNSKIKTCD